MEEAPPPLPGYNLADVFRLRAAIVDEAGYGHYNVTMTGRDYHAFLEDLARLLGPRGVEEEVLLDSCRDILDRELTEPLLFRLAWRLAGNLGRLQRDQAVPPWAGQRGPEWMPLEIVRGEPGRDRFDKLGSWFTFQVLAGSACPLTVRKFWSREACAFFATVLGFTRPWARVPLPYQHPLQLVRLRLYGLFDPRRSRDRPGFQQIRVPTTLVAHNVKILRVRARCDPCPRGYAHACHNCSIGYLPAHGACPAATHPTQWYAADCPGCGRPGRPFDGTLKSTVCVTCTRKRRTARKGEEL